MKDGKKGRKELGYQEKMSNLVHTYTIRKKTSEKITYLSKEKGGGGRGQKGGVYTYSNILDSNLALVYPV